METPKGKRVLLVRSDCSRWALPLSCLVRIAPPGPLLRLPRAPPGVCGAAMQDGVMVPVLDLPALLGLLPGGEGPVAYVRRAGSVIGLRVGAVERLGHDADPLDIEALALPDLPQRLAAVEPAPSRPARLPAAPPRGLLVRIGGRAFWLPQDQVLRVLDAVSPIPVPWADPRIPSLLLHEGRAVDVVRLDRLLGGGDATGPLVLCQAGPMRVAFRVDAVDGFRARDDATALSLPDLLRDLPGAGAGSARAAIPPPRTAQAYFAIRLASQLCLLPMHCVRGVSPHVRPAALPGAPPGLIGARPVGGRILPVVDARMALGLDNGESAAVDVTVVGATAFVLAAQQVDGIVRLLPGAVHPMPNGGPVAGIARLDAGLAWLLDPAALLQGASTP